MTKHILYLSFINIQVSNQSQLYGHNGKLLTFSTVRTKAGTNKITLIRIQIQMRFLAELLIS